MIITNKTLTKYKTKPAIKTNKFIKNITTENSNLNWKIIKYTAPDTKPNCNALLKTTTKPPTLKKFQIIFCSIPQISSPKLYYAKIPSTLEYHLCFRSSSRSTLIELHCIQFTWYRDRSRGWRL